MPRYIEVTSAAGETATKLLAMRTNQTRAMHITTNGGRTASVRFNDHTVMLNLPSLPPDSNLTRAEADRLVAFIAHECCHVLHTSDSAWRQAVAAGARVRAWTNALEDVRIEAAEIAAGHFPALRTVLATMANHLHYEAVTESAKHGRTIGSKIADAPYAACILGRVANGYDIPASTNLTAGLSRNTGKLVAHALACIGQCRDTFAVVTLAQELVAMEQALKQQQPQQPQQQPQQQQPQQQQQQQQQQQDDDASDDDASDDDASDDDASDDDASDDDASDDDASDDDASDDDASDDDTSDDDTSDDDTSDDDTSDDDTSDDDTSDDDASGDDAGDDDASGDDADDDNASDASDDDGLAPGIASDVDLTDAVTAIAKRAGIDDLDEHNNVDGSHKLSTAVVRVVPATVYGNIEAWNADCARNLAARLPRNSVLHGQIGRLLVTDEMRRRTHHESSGRLDRRALARMRVGATDVFSRRDETPGIDTALLLLIDASISMRLDVGNNHRRIDMATTAAWHIARAAEAANAKIAIASFHHIPIFGGGRETEVRMIKPWSAPAAACASQLYALSPDSQTPLSPAIIGAARMLAEVNATRHILMVLTDGDCDYGNLAVTAACRLAAAQGVETVGVGMACAEVTKAFPPRYSVNVEDLSQLATTGLGVLAAMLEDANPTAAE